MAINLKLLKEDNVILSDIVRTSRISYFSSNLPDGKPGLWTLSETADTFIFLLSSKQSNYDFYAYPPEIYVVICDFSSGDGQSFKLFLPPDTDITKFTRQSFSARMRSLFKLYLDSMPYDFTKNQAKDKLMDSGNFIVSGNVLMR